VVWMSLLRPYFIGLHIWIGVQVRFTGPYEMWAAACQVKRTFSRDVKSKPISPAQRHPRYPCPRKGAWGECGFEIWMHPLRPYTHDTHARAGVLSGMVVWI